MQHADTIEIGRAAERRVHFVCVVEEHVIDLVLGGLLAERDYRLEPMTPQDLRRQVGTSRLRRHAGRLDHPC